jgi:NAD+ diphosphatase
VKKMNFVSGIIPPNQVQDGLCFAFNNDLMLIKPDAKAHISHIPTVKELEDLGLILETKIYMGTLDNIPCFCVELPDYTPEIEGMAYVGLRQVFAMAGEELFKLAGMAIQIVNWDKNHKYCGQCGKPTGRLENERAKVCNKCGQLYFPRLSPAIIVAVIKDGKILLARNKNFKVPMFSVIAGFVEPGETLEDAVERELWEEVGIKVKNIKYFGSQPWPFPHSLMLGFTAEYAEGDIKIDGEEIAEARWFPPDDLPMIPEKMSIARKLIDWFCEKYR